MKVALVEEVSRVASGIVVQMAKDAITQCLVKWKRLEIESVAMRVQAAPRARLLLRRAHETPADAASSDGLCDPKLFDEEPIPVRMANQAANEFAALTRKNDQITMCRRWGLGFVVAHQRPHDLLTFLRRAMFADGNFDSTHW